MRTREFAEMLTCLWDDYEGLDLPLGEYIDQIHRIEDTITKRENFGYIYEMLDEMIKYGREQADEAKKLHNWLERRENKS